MTDRTVWLDETPGELRAVIEGPFGFEHILFETEGEDPGRRLGARSVGRVVRVEPGLNGAFVELACCADAFLPLKGGLRVAAGEKIEVEVSAESREAKGPTLRRLGPAEGAPRLLAPGPTIREHLARLCPGLDPIRGAAAIEAGRRALEEAVSQPDPVRGLRVTVERTRALIAVDLDLTPQPGRGVDARARARANQEGLREAARMIRLRRWAGLTVIDLVGAGHDGKAMAGAARAAFGDDPEIIYGPVNRFGVLQLALPWRFSPLEEALGRDPLARAALEAARRLNFELLSDTSRARITLCCPPAVATLAAPLVARLGPRAHLKVDETLRTGEALVETERS